MIISTSSHNILLTADIHELVDTTMRDRLKDSAEQVMSMDVFLGDATSLLGDSDKQVVVRIHLRNGRQLVAKALAIDLQAAVRRGAELASRAVRHNLRQPDRDERLPVIANLGRRRIASEARA